MISPIPVLDSKRDKVGDCKIYLRLIVGRKKLDLPTGIKVLPHEWNDEAKQIVKRAKHKVLNQLLLEKRQEYERRLAAQSDRNLSPAEIKDLLTKSEEEVASSKKVLIADYMYDLCDRYGGGIKWSPEYTRLVSSVARKIARHRPKDCLCDVSLNWMLALEKAFVNEDENKANTVTTRMKILKAAFVKAEADGLMSESQFKRYKAPRYLNPIASYLTEEEIGAFTRAVDESRDLKARRAGAYFLFACACGLRISDMKKFSPDKHIINNRFIVRATKNGSLVTMPVYSGLKEAMSRIKDHPFKMSEVTGNQKLKQLAALAGIEKEKMSFHVGRHTFAMLMLRKGLSVDEVAKLLGDTVNVAKIYASISNDQIHERFIQIFGCSDLE